MLSSRFDASKPRSLGSRIRPPARPPRPGRLDQPGLRAGPRSGRGGPCYQWTRKVRGKTVSVALSPEQYGALKQAIDNGHDAQAILQQMQALSRELIFRTLPDLPRRKP